MARSSARTASSTPSTRGRSTGSGATPTGPTIPWAISTCRARPPTCRARGALSPEVGVNLSYFLDDKGFARPTAPMPGEGPTWLSGLVVLNDRRGGASECSPYYAKIRKQLEVYEHGLVEFNPQTSDSRRSSSFPRRPRLPRRLSERPSVPVPRPRRRVRLYAKPYPLIRVPADPEQLRDLRVVRGLHLPEAGHPLIAAAVRPRRRTARCDTAGRRQYPAPAAGSAEQADLSPDASGPRRPCLHLRDVDSGKAVAGARRFGVLECVSRGAG